MTLSVKDEFRAMGGMRGVLDALSTEAYPSQTFHGLSGPYLTKYLLREDPDGSKLILHHFHRGDEDKELHSHPWSGTSLILAGGYREWRLVKGEVRDIRHVEGDLVPLNEGLYHRVELLEKSCWTLLVHGPSKKTWDFLDPVTGKKTPWKKFLKKKGLTPA